MHLTNFKIMKEQNFSQLVNEELKKQERNYRWLSKKTGIPYSTLYSIFVHKIFSASPEKVDLINKALNTNFSN